MNKTFIGARSIGMISVYLITDQIGGQICTFPFVSGISVPFDFRTCVIMNINNYRSLFGRSYFIDLLKYRRDI